MVLFTRGRRTDAQVFEENMADPATRAGYLQSLAGVVHYAALSRNTTDNYARARTRWSGYVSEAMPAVDGELLSKDIALEAPFPPFEHVKGFLRYVVENIYIHFEQYPTQAVLRWTLHSFLALWPHYAHAKLPRGTRPQAFRYLDSSELRTLSPLCSQDYVDTADLKLVVDAFLDADADLLSRRMRLQLVLACFLSSLSKCPVISLWPPTSTGSGADYYDAESFVWGNIDLSVGPNASDPSRPRAGIRLRLFLDRQTSSAYKDFWVFPEGDSQRCVFAILLSLALEDGIFEHVSTVQEILQPERAPRYAHTLSIQKEKEELPVLRAQRGEGDDDAEVMSYSTYVDYLRTVSLRAGLQHHLHPFDFHDAPRGLFDVLEMK